MILLSILLIALFAVGLWLAMAHLGMAVDSPWLAAHILSAIAAYVLFGAAVICAWLFMRHEKNLLSNKITVPRIPLLTLERWMFGFIYAGFVLLSISLIVGAVAGGIEFLLRPQHKSIFSVIAWICFAALIAGRQLLGWRGKQAVRFTYLGSIFLLLAYVGTRFVVEVILERGAV